MSQKDDLISRQAAIEAHERIFDRCEEIEAHLPEGDPDRVGYKMYPDWLTVWKYLNRVRSEETKQQPLTEDDYAYCTECDHVEMCRWYPMYGCEFKSRPSAEPEGKRERTESAIEYCCDCIHGEMCSWYPHEGCEFVETGNYAKGYNDAKREIALSGEYERVYQRGFEDGRKSEWTAVAERGEQE